MYINQLFPSNDVFSGHFYFFILRPIYSWILIFNLIHSLISLWLFWFRYRDSHFIFTLAAVTPVTHSLVTDERKRMREGERERRAGNNHHRHRPSAAIIRRHARLLRARYVDLLQKTLLPSFLLARSRHALFSAPPLRPMPTGCPSFIPSHVYTIFPPLDAIRAPLNARTHAHTHVRTHPRLGVRAYPGRNAQMRRCACKHACVSV